MKLRIGIFLVVLNSITINLFATGVQTFSKEIVGNSSAKVGEVITYDLKSACNSLTSDCGTLTITDSLPDGMVIDSCVVPTGFTATQCDAGTKNIEIVKDSTFNGGDSFVMQIKAVIELDASSTVDIVNSATSVISSPSDSSPGTITTNSGAIDVQDRVPNWKVYKSRISPSSSLKPTWDTDVTYQLKFCSLSAVGNVDLSGVIMEDIFPDNVEVVNNGGGTLTASNTLTWDLGNIDLPTLYTGKSLSSTQCISKNYILKYPNSNFNAGDAIQNSVNVTANRVDTGGSVNSSKVLDDTIGIPTPGASLSKSANDVLPNEDLVWSIVANVDSSNAPVPNLKIYETFTPSTLGIVAKSISSGQWSSPATTNALNGSSVKAKIMAATDSEGNCVNANYSVDLSGGFIASPASSTVYNLTPNITCVRWEFQDDAADGPAVPRGWSMTTAPQVVEDTTGYGGALPVSVSNCINATFTNFDSTTGNTGAQCGTANIEEATPEIIANKFVANSSLKPGEETMFTLEFKHDKADSTGPTVNPTITDLLPEALEFISWDSVTGLNGEAEPNLEIIDNYNGTNRKLLRFSWSSTAPATSLKLDGTAGIDNSASFDEDSLVRINFTARFKAGTLAGNYTNTMQFFDNSARVSCDGTPIQDSDDLDGDGDTAELMCNDGQALIVLQAAVLGGEKWIKGDPTLEHVNTLNPNSTTNALCPNDLGFTRYPCVAQTTRSGSFEYLFKLTNMGNEPLKDYIVYDVLPALNDTGVGEPLATTARGTQWVPTLQGAITANNAEATNALAQTGAVIEYSMASNPCRPEVSSTADESGWQSACTDDWTATPADYELVTAFRIKLPFSDSTWSPASELQFKASMKAPDNALVSDVTLSSKLVPAWNSIAHRVTQASNDSRLSSAEPKRVGIVVPKGSPVSIGSVIWNDKDRNGMQDAGENLITERTVFVLKDSLNRDVTDNDNIIVQPISTLSGKYRFNNLPEGNYTITVQPNSHYIVSPIQTTVDNDNNETDSNIKTSNGNGTYTSSIFELTNNNEPTEINTFQGADDLDDNDDENSGNMTVDFGFYRLSTLGNYVWYDADQDGIQDSNERGVSSVKVTLYQNCTVEISSMNTDPNGKYLFTQLEAGDYCVGFSNIPTGYLFTQKGSGTVSTGSDANLDSNKTDMVSLVLDGEDDLTWDAGIITPIISGTIFDDGNNDGTVNGNPTSKADGQLYVNLLDSSNNLLSSKAVSSNGTYRFNGDDGVMIDTSFFIVLSSTANSVVASLPANWNNADGEHIGTGAGLDNAVDGKISVDVVQSNIEEINFGINEKPIAGNVSNPIQFNPGADIAVDVADLNGSDKESNTLIYIITELPNDSILYYDNTQILNSNYVVADPSKLTVNPNSGALTIKFKYTVTDEVNVTSEPATVTIPFKNLKVSGNLFIDGNGDNNINGTATSSADGTQLYVTLVNGGAVVASSPLSAGGAYAFDIEDGVRANTSYTVVLSDSNGSAVANLPADWDNHDGENINSVLATGNDGSKDGVLAVNVVESDVTQADFGINKKPNAEDVTEPEQINPGASSTVAVPDLNISDSETQNNLTVTIITVPDNGTLYYNGAIVDANTTITGFQNNLLTIDPHGGSQAVNFDYSVTDAAGTVSDAATVSLSFANIMISGTLFNDGNGNGNVDGNETNHADATQLYVTLVDASATPIASKPLDANGSYYFDSIDNLSPDTNYTVVLTDTLNSTGATLPATWNNADGEKIGLVGLDGNADGIVAVEVQRVDIPEINFGINKQPVAEDKAEALQYNPGSTTQVVVPDLNVTDKEDGVPTIVTITILPTNGTLYYEGNLVVVNTPIADVNLSGFTFDPNDGDLTATFKYTTTDRVDVDSEVATVTLPFTALKISGNIFNDGDNDNTVNGVGISAPSGTQLFVTLLDENGTALASKEVNGDGTYTFGNTDGIIENSDYKVVLSTGLDEVNASLPVDWTNLDGEHIGTDAGTDGSKDGMIFVAVASADVVQVNFGINKKPVAGDYVEPLQLNPGGNVQVNVPDLNITDNEDGALSTVTIQTVPSHGTLYYNGVEVVAGQVINDLNNSLLTLDPDNGDQTVSFTYSTVDGVGVESDIATVSMLFDGLEISGNIFNDGNNDNTVNGTKISDINGTQLYATLLDDSGVVMATMAIDNNGSYLFTGADGIVPSSSYSVVLSTEANATTSTLPTDWNHADGEHIGTGVGLDGTADGFIAVEVVAVDVPEVNFGVNERPKAQDKTENLRINPGSNNQVSVPTLEVSDREDGIPSTVVITTLPTNGILYYNGVAVVLDENISNVDASKFTIDPDHGDLNVSFNYESIDVTGWKSEPAEVVMPFYGLEISGQVFLDVTDDHNIDGAAFASTYGLPVYATLLDDNGTIVASIPVDSNGSYLFDINTGIAPSSNYKVVLSSEENTTIATLPSNWEHADSNNNGIIDVAVALSDVTHVDFGLNQQPVVTNVVGPIIVNPDGNKTVEVPALDIAVNEDGTSVPTTVTLTDLPNNGTLYYNGIAVVEGQSFTDFNNSLLTVDPSDYNLTVEFTYTVEDTAGFESEPATVKMPFDDSDTDGDGVKNGQDIDDDNDGILDTVEEATASNGGDTDGDGLPDRIDLDADGDGILDLEESDNNRTAIIMIDADGNGVLDSLVDVDGDGLMDTADMDDNNSASGAIVTPVDTDGDGKPDFQDVDSDNDGLSDLVEGSFHSVEDGNTTITQSNANLDSNNDGVIDDLTDSDSDGIADVVDVDNNGTVASTPDTDGDGDDNYRDLDSDGDTLLDVDEINATDANHDGLVDVNGTLVDGSTLPDENNNSIPDVLEVKLEDDVKSAPAGSIVTINLLENDSGDVDPTSISLIIPSDFNGTARLSRDQKTMVVDGEGEWSVDINGTVTFTPEAGFSGNPTPILYKASNVDGSKTATAKITIFVTALAGVTTDCVCTDYSSGNSVPTLSLYGLLFMLLMGSLFGARLMRKES